MSNYKIYYKTLIYKNYSKQETSVCICCQVMDAGMGMKAKLLFPGHRVSVVTGGKEVGKITN